jgi:transposase
MVDLLRIILQKGKVTAATIRLGWIAVLPTQGHVKHRESRLSAEADLLKTLPCVGKILSMVLMLEIGKVDRFPTAAHLASYAGGVPHDADIDDVVSLKTGERTTLHHGGFFARYLPSVCR